MQKPPLPFLLGGQRGFMGRSSSATAAWLLWWFSTTVSRSTIPSSTQEDLQLWEVPQNAVVLAKQRWGTSCSECQTTRDAQVTAAAAHVGLRPAPEVCTPLLSWVFLPQSLLLSTWAALSSQAHPFLRYEPKENRCHATTQSFCLTDVQAYNKTSPN